MEAALNDIFPKNRTAVVKIKVAEGEAFGFFVSSDGYLVISDFAIPKPDADVTIITISRERQKAFVKDVSEDYGITVLKADVKGQDFLILGDSPPRVGQNVLVIGSTGTEHLIPDLGRVQRVTELDVEYWHEQETMFGFPGGPVIDKNGIVIGVHRAGWKNKQGSGGIGQCRRADKIKEYLRSLGIKVS